jgi:hypothetical protein
MIDSFKKEYCAMMHFPFEGIVYSIFNISVKTQNQITG